MKESAMYSRKFVQFKNRKNRLWKIYRTYRQVHDGIADLANLAVRLCKALLSGGFDNLRAIIGAYERSLVDTSVVAPQLVANHTLSLEGVDPILMASIEGIAVHAHVYYAILAPEMREYLENIPAKFDLYVTTDTENKAVEIRSSLTGIVNVRMLDVRVVPNRGRDIGPLLVALGDELSRYGVVLHIHTKRSPHNPDLRGWRRYLMQALLGDLRLIAAILGCFAKDEQLGILYPQIYYPVIPFMRLGGNADGIISLLKRAGRDAADIEQIDMSAFPAGFMFWFRGSALKPFLRLGLQLADFEAEAGQDDGTLAHAIERIFPYMTAVDGFHSQAFLPARLHAPAHLGALPLRELLPILSATSYEVCIIFDHKTIGDVGSNCVDLINKTIAAGHTVLRINHANSFWIVEWIAADDGMVFVEASTEKLFKVLAKVGADVVIVGEQFICPEIDKILQNIADLVALSGSNYDCKLPGHTICHKQHLIRCDDKS